MIQLIAQYKIKKGTEPGVLEAISEFVSAIHQQEPDTDYRAYRLQESREFLHIMTFTDRTAQKIHQTAEYTKRFVDVLYPNCEMEPQFSLIKEIE